jgi:hypothetical protein
MSIITLPAAVAAKLAPGSGVGQRRFDLMSQSDSNGAQQARLLGPPRWTLQLVQPAFLTLAEGGLLAALVLQLRGRVNVLAAWDPARPAPAGTLRGTLTLASAAAVGDTTVSVTGGAGQAARTVAAGDWFQIGSGLGTSQLVMCTAAATANGSGVVSVYFEPPLRTAFASATAVAWDKPLAYYRQQTESASWTYINNGAMVSGLSLDLLEVWA